jgi:hypothetical protein
MRLIILNSMDEGCDRIAVIPPVSMTTTVAEATIDAVIITRNIQDSQNGGECDDGLSVREGIEKDLSELGFVVAECSVAGRAWDEDVADTPTTQSELKKLYKKGALTVNTTPPFPKP